jgi:riboflavin kinase / FMN adenylyltransferase
MHLTKIFSTYLRSQMQVHRSIKSLPNFQNAVITIGTFDGVHLGHQKIISALVQEAKNAGGESVIITFNPHPRKIVNPAEHLQLINTLQEKIDLLQNKGVDHLVIVPFTAAFSEQEAETYIQDFLVKLFHPHTIIIGYDHHFGKNRKGHYRLLEQKAATYNYRLKEIPKHVLNEIDISSTKIRKALLASDIATANKLLGYDYFFEGMVVQGDKMGRQLGYPTANLKYTNEDKIRLGEGVYAVYVKVKGEEKKGMMSIGTRPTFNDTSEKVEVNIFDFDADIYGAVLSVQVKQYLRPQEKYDTIEALIAQIDKDKEDSLKVL